MDRHRTWTRFASRAVSAPPVAHRTSPRAAYRQTSTQRSHVLFAEGPAPQRLLALFACRALRAPRREPAREQRPGVIPAPAGRHGAVVAPRAELTHLAGIQKRPQVRLLLALLPPIRYLPRLRPWPRWSADLAVGGRAARRAAAGATSPRVADDGLAFAHLSRATPGYSATLGTPGTLSARTCRLFSPLPRDARFQAVAQHAEVASVLRAPAGAAARLQIEAVADLRSPISNPGAPYQDGARTARFPRELAIAP